MNDQELDAQFRAAPREATPPRDLWVEVERRLGTQRRHWLSSPALRAAAAIVLMVLSMGIGMAYEHQRAARVVREAEVVRSRSAFLAAAAVQEAGSAYLAALARLGAMKDDASAIGAISQGFEAGLAALETAATSVEETGLLTEEGTGLSDEARVLRDAMSRRVSRLVRGERP
jgi:hypothetical protein